MSSPIQPMPFAVAEKKLKLTRHGAFDTQFESAYVLDGDLEFSKNATGADILRAFGFKKAPAEPGLFVISGGLTVKGALDLDAGLHFSMGLAVLGSLEATALRLDATMLFVFKNARVDQAIFFEANDGTLSVAGKTICPLVVCHEGDLNVAATGEVFNSMDEGPIDGGTSAEEPVGAGFPESRVTMTLTEAKERLIGAVFDDDEFSSDKAYRRAAKGLTLFRPVKPAAKTAPDVTSVLTPVPIVEGKNATSLVSDGTHLWMAAESLFMFDGKRFTRMWRHNPDGSCDNPPGTPAGLVFTLVGPTLVASGYAIPAYDQMLARGFGEQGIPIATSDDLGVSWKELVPPSKFGLVAQAADGVAMFRAKNTLSRAGSMTGPWRDVVIPGEVKLRAQCMTLVGDELWIALVDESNQGVVSIVRSDGLHRVDFGQSAPVRRIVATTAGVLLLGDSNLVLLTTDGGKSFTKGLSPAVGNIADATQVGDAIYAVGGLPISKRPKDNLGFLMRSNDGGRTFEMLAEDIPGRMWAVTAHGTRLFLAGTAKTAFTYALTPAKA